MAFKKKLQAQVCISLLTSGLESFDYNSTPSHKPWTEAYYPKLLVQIRVGPINAKRSTFYLGQDAIHFPGCPFGTSTAPQTFPLTAASYLHTTSTSLLSICFMSSSVFEPHLWGKNHCPCSRFFNGNLNTPLRLGQI